MAVNVFCGHQVAPVDETRHHFGPKAPVMLYPRGQRGRGGMNGSGIHCGEQLSHTALHELRRPEYAERIVDSRQPSALWLVWGRRALVNAITNGD